MDLMTPRYKVSADWPNRQFMVGAILNIGEPLPDGRIRVWVEHEDQKEWYLWDPAHNNHPKDYPHLFKPLEWHEDRKPEDMPQYIRLTRVGLVKKVEKWYEGLRCFDAMHEGRIYSYDIETPRHESEQRFMPASYEEYLAANPSAKLGDEEVGHE